MSEPATERAVAERADTVEHVVTAHEVTRRYGEGDTAVDALRGVSLDVAPGKLTAVMGSPRSTGRRAATSRSRARGSAS